MIGNQQKKISSLRLWLFRIIAITIFPALLFLLLEMGLRIFGVGYNTNFLIKCNVNGRKAYCNNNKFSWQFFPPKIARHPASLVIDTDKPERTYRIFVLGGSAAQGDPKHSFSFGRILEVMLRDQYPGVNFEVVNAAMTAINSHVVLEIAKDLVRHQSDLFIVYLGNNEVVGPFGAGTVFSPLSPRLSLIRAGIFFKSTRIGQLLRELLKLHGDDKDTPKVWGGMSMFLDKQVQYDNPALKSVYAHFKENLKDIIRIAIKSKTKVIVNTVGVNLKDSAPFASLHRRDMTEYEKNDWEKIYQAGIKLESEGQYDKALQQYIEAAHQDNSFADLQYRIGRSYWALGKYDESRDRYIRALEMDTLRFRADKEINNIIRSVADGKSQKGVYLVDAVRSFEKNSPHRMQGDELFYDHVHMNFKGNYILAKNVFQQVADILPDWIRQAKSKRSLLTEDESAKLLAFTDFERREIVDQLLFRLEKPPYTNQTTNEGKVRKLQQRLNDLDIATSSPHALRKAEIVYRKAIQEAGSDPWLHYNYADLLEESKNYEGAAEQLRIFIRYIPYIDQAHEALSAVLIQLGRYEEGIAQSKEALRINPHFVQAYLNIAFALARLGKLEQSLKQYEEALLIDPERSIEIYNAIGQIFIHQGKLEKAAETFQKAINFNAESKLRKNIPDVHFKLIYVLKKLGKPEEALQKLRKTAQEYREQLLVNPRSSETHAVLGKISVELEDFKQATEHFQQAADLDPSKLNNHVNLIKVLEVQGKFDAAIEASKKAVQLMLNRGQKDTAAKLQRYLSSLELRKSKQK
jgi:tetratricopeptide (TPR) repeat protein